MSKHAAAVSKWALQSQQAKHLNAMTRHAAPYLQVDVRQLDASPFKLAVRNGTLVFGRGPDGKPFARLCPHDPDDMITHFADVPYDPAATCRTYDQALALVQPNPEVVDFLHRIAGYALTGDVSEQVFFFFYGTGRNGKSTTLETWATILGSYAATIPIEAFLQHGNVDGGKPTPHLARLRGVRMLRCSEPERGAELAEALIKLITSGEPMLVRELNRPFFELHPQFKLFMSGNYRPHIRGTDEGIWRRVILVPWHVRITDEQCIPNLAVALQEEASGILNRMIAGLLAWMANGLAIPEVIAAATAAYRTESDHLGRFLEECVILDPNAREPARDLYEVYQAWANESGAPPWKATGFGRAMRDRGFDNVKSGNHYWLRVRLIKRVADFASARHRPNDEPGRDEPIRI